MLKIHTGLLEPMQPLAELLALRRCELQCNRQQQLLRSVFRTSEFLIIIFVIHPFMRRVLINQIQTGVILGNNIGPVMLTNIIQLRKLRQRGIFTAGGSIQLLRRRHLAPRGERWELTVASATGPSLRLCGGLRRAAGVCGRPLPRL
ncbi:hypothetical protein D3C75_895690 [compost metagenome]